jgi:two-component system, chemotaxis family, protein-glutamate methylesterase/glutaminase
MSELDMDLKIGCPDCAGVLTVTGETPENRGFVCQIGHSYSLNSAIEAKEHQLERYLWSTVVLLRHAELLYNEAVARAQQAGQSRRTEQAERRRSEVRRQASIVRQLITQGQLPALEE